MLIPILVLSVTLNLSELSFDALESLYWDCDASFMKGEMGGNDMLTCLTITDEFQKHFWDKFVFSQYWNAQKRKQWAIRGYKPKFEHDDD